MEAAPIDAAPIAALSFRRARRGPPAGLAALFLTLPASASATVFVFNTAAVHKPAELLKAIKLAAPCANIHVRFRIGARPDHRGAQVLSKAISDMESAGFRYYITAASSDYSLRYLFWNPKTICRDLQEQPHSAGIYLHEILSATIGSGHPFGKDAWEHIRQYASCASQLHKTIIWSEWAGGNWGWSAFLSQVQRPGTEAHRVISQYRNTFVLLWANNRDLRNPGQRSDMLLARKLVRRLGTASSPVGYPLRHGVSIQDWQWFETNKNARGQIPHDAGKTLPPNVISKPGISGYAHGARYFEFETYWNNPRMFAGIVQLRDYIISAKACPAK